MASPPALLNPPVPSYQQSRKAKVLPSWKNQTKTAPLDSVSPCGYRAPHSPSPRTFHTELSSRTPLSPESCPLHLHKCPHQVSPGHLVPKPHRLPQVWPSILTLDSSLPCLPWMCSCVLPWLLDHSSPVYLPFGASVLPSLPSLGKPTQLGTGDPVKNLFVLQLPSMQAPRGSSHPALSPDELTHTQGFSCLLEAVDPQIYMANGSSGLACPTAS